MRTLLSLLDDTGLKSDLERGTDLTRLDQPVTVGCARFLPLFRSRCAMVAAAIAVIPARLRSTRLPGKALAEIAGVPMIVRVWEQTRKASLLHRVLVATDDEGIADTVRTAGGDVEMT